VASRRVADLRAACDDAVTAVNKAVSIAAEFEREFADGE
jgi:hypothetical protein